MKIVLHNTIIFSHIIHTLNKRLHAIYTKLKTIVRNLIEDSAYWVRKCTLSNFAKYKIQLMRTAF